LDHRWYGQGIGKALLRDAMLSTLQAADIAGILAVAVHAKNEAARGFYEKFDFVPSPTDPMHLFVLLKDVRRIVPRQDCFHSVSPLLTASHYPPTTLSSRLRTSECRLQRGCAKVVAD
jgi:hypothetical protein